MRRLWALYLKEMLENVRSYKLIWVPVVFIVLGIMQPLVSFYMADILAFSSNVPAGLMENMERPAASSVMAQALGQYGTIGMLILVLGTMNSLAGERSSGTSELLMAKPVSSISVVAAKWTANFTVLVIAIGLGTAGAAYYTVQLMGLYPGGCDCSVCAVCAVAALCGIAYAALQCLAARTCSCRSISPAGSGHESGPWPVAS